MAISGRVEAQVAPRAAPAASRGRRIQRGDLAARARGARAGTSSGVGTSHCSGALWPVPRWSISTRSRRCAQALPSGACAVPASMLHQRSARMPAKKRHRIGLLLARERGDDDHVLVDLRALRLGRVERPLEHAALRVVLEAAAGLRQLPAAARLAGATASVGTAEQAPLAPASDDGERRVRTALASAAHARADVAPAPTASASPDRASRASGR